MYSKIVGDQLAITFFNSIYRSLRISRQNQSGSYVLDEVTT